MQRSSLGGRLDVYQAITARIVEAIEAGAGEFVMPWHRSGASVGRPTNAATGKAYQGGNVVALWAEGMLSGYGSGHWATYRQWGELGAQVRKGSKGAAIMFFKAAEAAGEEDEKPGRRLIARASYVFNADQVDGWERAEVPRPGLAEVLPAVEAFVARTGAHIRHGGDVACYRRFEDIIDMPDRNRFLGSPTSSPTESYYATLLHELIHWTGAAHRLNRTFGARMGDEAYAFEELVAELGAAFLCADLGTANAPQPDHAAYLAGWVRVLKDDARALFRAARLAGEAMALLSDEN